MGDQAGQLKNISNFFSILRNLSGLVSRVMIYISDDFSLLPSYTRVCMRPQTGLSTCSFVTCYCPDRHVTALQCLPVRRNCDR